VIQQEFAIKAKEILEKNKDVIGLAVGGSWLTNEIDEYSDLDLILVTKTKVSDDKNKMVEFAQRLGNLLSGFTGEHVGEPRVLICLYDKPLLHVDIKFLTLAELDHRVETPQILFDRNGEIKTVFQRSKEKFPLPDYQWIENRFWTWVHYALLKIGRGEYFEAFDFFGFLRMKVFGPLLHMKNGNLPRAVRKVEVELNKNDLGHLKMTIPKYERQSLLDSLQNSVDLYRNLRKSLFDDKIKLQRETEEKVMEYFKLIEKRK
jgi:predicted nucleotidyltransferase